MPRFLFETKIVPPIHSQVIDTQIDINHVLGKLFDALSANRISIKRATALAYIACLTVQTQEGAKEEARRWELDLPIFKKLLRLKYPKDHPNYPRPDKPPATAKSPEPPTPSKPAPKSSPQPAPEPSSSHTSAP